MLPRRGWSMMLQSRDNKLVKHTAHLLSSRNYRYDSEEYVIEGFKMASEAIDGHIPIKCAFFSEEAYHKYADLALKMKHMDIQTYEVSKDIFEKLSDTKTPQGITCIAKMLDKPLTADKIDSNGKYLAIEQLQDPGNMGTIIRTADAFGLDGIILSVGCVDVYSPKVLRSTMGSIFRIPIIVVDDLTATLRGLSQKNMITLAAVVGGTDAIPLDEIKVCSGVVVVIGNEANGLSDEVINACTEKITIPMSGNAESLNAAVTAGIIIWKISKIY
jgi:TrmH family RNA methyltransferase